MKSHFLTLLLIAFFVSCDKTAPVNNDDQWLSNALSFEVDEMKNRNGELHGVLIKMNPGYPSIRELSFSHLKALDEIKAKIWAISYDSTVEISTAQRRPGTKNLDVPLTVVFKKDNIAQLSSDVINSIKSFDQNSFTEGNLNSNLDTILNGMMDEAASKNKGIFENKTIGHSIEIIELIQLQILLQEYKYMNSQFDHAINTYMINELKSTDNQE